MPLQETSGNVTTDAYGGGAAAVPNYIEDVFSTYLYTGNGGAQSITNGINLSTNGGLTWIKMRDGAQNNALFDTLRGPNVRLQSDSTTGNQTATTTLSSFNTNGFSLNGAAGVTNSNGFNYASWTFRKQPKFFDVVTFTSTTSTNQRISHSLGSVPGMIIVKGTNNPTSWMVWHRSLSTTTSNYMELQSTAAQQSQSNVWGTSGPTSTDFGIDGSWFGSGGQWVAYIFAHNAGGFGLTGTDNVISCGSFTTDGSGNATVNLGYEAQWVMVKPSSNVGFWSISDNMRGMSLTNDALLKPNLSNSEVAIAGGLLAPTATGFSVINAQLAPSTTYIYIAIRRGPMKVPTDATKVFAPVATSATAGTSMSVGFPADWVFGKSRNFSNADGLVDRLRGFSQATATPDPQLRTNSTAAETTANTPFVYNVNNTTALIANALSGNSQIYYFTGRAPNFFDEVCYTGTGSARTVTHNLGVAPELMIVRNRPNSGGYNWTVYSSTIGPTKALYLNDTLGGQTYSGFWNDTAPTSSVFTVGIDGGVNANTSAIVAYLFATCPNVSKVGTYTGNGTTQTIDCGFTGGARFVLIKRTNATGDWYVYDTARGMTTLTDPYLLLNTTAAESATLGSVTTVSTGFAVNSSILAAINLSGSTYTFLAIA